MTVVYLISDTYLLCLYWYALRKTGFLFFRILLVVSVLWMPFGVLHVLIACAEDWLRFDVFGYHAYYNLLHFMYVLRPAFGILNIFASTLMILWIVRTSSLAEKV